MISGAPSPTQYTCLFVTARYKNDAQITTTGDIAEAALGCYVKVKAQIKRPGQLFPNIGGKIACATSARDVTPVATTVACFVIMSLQR
jgi:hypothetical protein